MHNFAFPVATFFLPLSTLLGVWIFRDMTADRRGCFDQGSFDILILVWGACLVWISCDFELDCVAVFSFFLR